MIQLSQSALSEVQRIKSKSSNPAALLRVSVRQGGCADWYYTLMLDDAATSDDRVFTYEGIDVVVDPNSVPYLTGLNLDYSEDLMGGGFRFHNPNAVSSCGCGNSFSVDAAYP
ncbi:MAG: iron-sulfur cluster assembly accessory protein [Cyanobacteria bacterium RM1_2_2]|nr:iron-sulfur cluster assembly accessory protein [Cyanobacteria bacterium RM1_2_2]